MKVILVIVFLMQSLVFGYSNNVSPYPLISGNISHKHNLSKQGIPLQTINGKSFYNPVAISGTALRYYKNYIQTKNENSKYYFLKLAKWLKNNFEENNTFGGWYFNTNLPGFGYHLSNHWLSAMSQGYGLSVMLEAHLLTGDHTYMDIAQKALNSFTISTVNGGVMSKWGTTTWYDEYPTVPEKHVLNGFIFSLAGLYNYYCYTNDKLAKKLFDNGVLALKEHLASFDAGFNSYYSRSTNDQTKHTIASATGFKYHDLHSVQLLWIYQVTKDDFFKKWVNLFLQKNIGPIGYGINNKYKTVTASHTIDPKKHGTDNLTDGLWTYGNYWSTYKFPTTLDIEFSRTISKLNKFVLVSINSKIPSENFKFHVYQNEKWIPIDVKLVNWYSSTTDKNHKALVQEYQLATTANNISKVKIIFNKSQEKVLALREINFHYDMSQEIAQLIKQLDYKPCK